MSSNLPDGVTDAHPAFNPPAESVITVQCENDETQVIPAHLVRQMLEELRIHSGGNYKGDGGAGRPANHGTIAARIMEFQAGLHEVALDSDYACPFEGEMELPEGADVEWTCPLCGATRTTDNLPEEQDPDQRYEEMRDARYDD